MLKRVQHDVVLTNGEQLPALHIPNSSLVTPRPKLRIPHSSLRIPHSAFRTYYVPSFIAASTRSVLSPIGSSQTAVGCADW